jgi:SAM-dependent methyltransferase
VRGTWGTNSLIVGSSEKWRTWSERGLTHRSSRIPRWLASSQHADPGWAPGCRHKSPAGSGHLGHHREVEPWTLDEGAHVGPEHLDPEYVAAYDKKSGVDPVDDLVVLERHGLDRTSIVVDLGAGTGTFTLAVAPHCRRVIAVDVSLAMLNFMSDRISKAALGNVEFVKAGYLSYQHAGMPADIVYTRNALHHVPDFWKAIALSRIAEMLRAAAISGSVT